MKITIGDAGREIVADAEHQMKAVEPLRRQHGEILRPERTILKPRFVLDIADKRARNAANGIGRFFANRLHVGQRSYRVGCELDAICQFEQGIDRKSTRLNSSYLGI